MIVRMIAGRLLRERLSHRLLRLLQRGLRARLSLSGLRLLAFVHRLSGFFHGLAGVFEGVVRRAGVFGHGLGVLAQFALLFGVRLALALGVFVLQALLLLLHLADFVGQRLLRGLRIGLLQIGQRLRLRFVQRL